MRVLVLAAALMAGCGGGKPGWVKHQKDLLDDEIPDAPKAEAEQVVQAPEGPKPPPAPGPALPVSAGDATRSRCVGFTDDGTVALVITEDRQHGGDGTRTQLVAEVGTLGDAKGLRRVELADYQESADTEDVLGDALEATITEHIPALNQQVDTHQLVTCAEAETEVAAAGQFKRKVKTLIAFPAGHLTRITVRDKAVWVQPEGKGARAVHTIEAEEVPDLDAVWYVPDGPNLAILLKWKSSTQTRTKLVFAPGQPGPG